MLTIGMLIVLVGYGLAYTGKQMWDGCNPNVIEIFTPGKYTPCSQTSTGTGTTGTVQGSSGVTTTTAPVPSVGTGGSVGPYAGLGPKANG